MENFDLSPLALAFVGDAIHTAFVRKFVLLEKHDKISNYHTAAKKFCNAKSQRLVLDALKDRLTEEETDLVRRARNCHPKHSAKNFGEEDYKKATAFEALVGHLFLTKQTERLEEILKFSVECL